MTNRLLAISAIVFASSALVAQIQTGQWVIHQNIGGSESDQPCKFVVAGNKIIGSCNGQGRDLAVTGSIDEKKVIWQYQVEKDGIQLTLVYTGILDGSGGISGTVEVQPYGVMVGSFTAAPAPAPPPSK
jgi:hypothetical protein